MVARVLLWVARHCQGVPEMRLRMSQLQQVSEVGRLGSRVAGPISASLPLSEGRRGQMAFIDWLKEEGQG